ncbi:tRNA (adenosine(37)-N6)-threonylcarbamoyltransferase complex transferase subunit TsaD, partial [Candidatus Woesebacteria bacterium]|nr:tRNA (adenosine(37)-N6)-threonylcarbamoyltransferase complex transferase subunit TsaD [Candidatus Woesebacteria bacterium]
MNVPLILAIDTSCDETSVAVTRGSTIISNVVSSQVELHRPYGGVFPTVAKLAHQENLAPAVALALQRAGVAPDQLSAVAVTIGPGLAPAL